MGRIVWDSTGEKYFETGTRNGVLYVQDPSTAQYGTGVAWNGLTGFTESPTGAESNKMYADDILYADLRSAEELEGSLTAYTYPDEFAECDGSAEVVDGMFIGQQVRKKFGFCYRSTIGNDVSNNVGYKLHIIYGATASPSEKAYATINDSPEGIEFSWDITTTPVNVSDVSGKSYKPTACVILDSRKYTSTEGRAKLKQIEDTLYGVDASEAVAAVYTATQDATKQAGKTYYTKDGTTYTQFSGSEFANGTTYYELTTPAQDAVTAADPRLLLPDEIVQILSA